ncbi:MAG TPA: sigma-70 family RNA polymerase sigma factor [Chitinophaga sp.]|uniref:RNA polymerase sigma factor n=1 Tax=Chitinophaga sp. TaxID=1869181 RepID=UPI002BA4456B|nr:sigma-70 family RNA polymerase sigma factor [Chitinophaga sp.]HVI47309.1 sigma-70 family RNA polymerase sigma factor [Chitinophaga sp.]
MPKAIDPNLIIRLKDGDNTSYEDLYQHCFPAVAGFIRQNNGNDHDAADIFQEAVIVLLHKIKQPGFVLTSSVKTYLFAVSKNLWLRKLRDDKYEYCDNDKMLMTCEHHTDETHTEGQYEQLKDWFKRITAQCQQVLKALFFMQEPMETLMHRMGWKNKHTASNQKYKCLQQIEKIKRKEGC